MVAWAPGLFSLLGEETFFPGPTDFFLSPLALAGPNGGDFAAWLWWMDFSFDRPETYRHKDKIKHTDKIKRKEKKQCWTEL